MRIAMISDTHGSHDKVVVPPCDLLIHAGDMTRHGDREELDRFLLWFSAQPAARKICVPGNHDVCCEDDPAGSRSRASALGIDLLCDSGAEACGARVWGSPVTPVWRRMAYNRDRGDAIREHWAKIPARTDILVTHGPPRGLGDLTAIGTRAGCDDLLAKVRELRPAVHVFGHIHEGGGEYRLAGLDTRFFNASTRRWLIPGLRAPLTCTLDL